MFVCLELNIGIGIEMLNIVVVLLVVFSCWKLGLMVMLGDCCDWVSWMLVLV